MRIINEVTRDEILRQFSDHRDAKYFVETPYAHYYRVALSADEFRRLLTNSSPSRAYPEPYEFPLLETSVRELIERPERLQERHPWRGLSGVTVDEYVEAFRRGKRLENCFVSDRAPNMPAEGSYFISEGMHRLVAYGLYRQLEVDDHEVTVCYMTDREPEEWGRISGPAAEPLRP